MKIYLGADHRGFELKEKIKTWLAEWGYTHEDMGNEKYEAEDDFPDYAVAVAEAIQQHGGKGILSCSSGGMAMVANKFKGIRAVEVWNEQTAAHASAHDNANVLMLPANFVTDDQAKAMVKIWLETKMEMGEKYQRRLAKIKQIEEEVI